MAEPEEDTANARALGISAAARLLGVSVSYVRLLSDEGKLPYTLTPGGHRRYEPAPLREAWARFRSAQKATLRWEGRYAIAGLDEDDVWRALSSQLPSGTSSAARTILNYAVTEMANNAIDHSEGAELVVAAASDARTVMVRIADDGVGAFQRIADGLGLDGPEQAVVEVTKGKRTTAPATHSGEGLFFTSKAVDAFEITANGIVVAFDNTIDDVATGSAVGVGTTVVLGLTLDSTRSLTEVFGRYAPIGDDDTRGFTRTVPRVSLISHGGAFISRSEAKRFAAGLEEFATVTLDFAGLDLIGQGFADELFRVWQNAHPTVELLVEGASPGVRLMIDRVDRPARG